MTLHEVSIAIPQIIKRKKQEMKFHAACLGATMKDEEQDDGDFEAITQEQEAAISKAVAQRGKKYERISNRS